MLTLALRRKLNRSGRHNSKGLMVTQSVVLGNLQTQDQHKRYRPYWFKFIKLKLKIQKQLSLSMEYLNVFSVNEQ